MAADSHPERSAEHHEGQDAAQRFEHTMRRVLTISKAELTKREATYKKSRHIKKLRSNR